MVTISTRYRAFRRNAAAIAGLLALAAASPAAAIISDLTFHGTGFVTYSIPDPSYEFGGSAIVGPVVGTPVNVNLHIHLGDAFGVQGDGIPAPPGQEDDDLPPAPADDFTGRFVITQEMAFQQYSSFTWSVSPVLSYSTLDFFAYTGGMIDFVNGKAVDFYLWAITDPDEVFIRPTTWGYDFDPLYSPARWGGTWAIDSPAGPVPEPGSWALMIAGFGLVGTAVRRRRGESDSALAAR